LSFVGLFIWAGGKTIPTEGPAKKKIDEPPRTFAKSQTHPPTTRLFFLDIFFSCVLGRFSVRGVQKHHKNIFTKVHVERKFKISTKISMSVFPRLFLFYRVFGCFSAIGVQKQHKKRFTKKIVSKSFLQKIRPKIQNRFFLDFVLSRFWAFLDEGSSKTR
jgi:hypothetical protein